MENTFYNKSQIGTLDNQEQADLFIEAFNKHTLSCRVAVYTQAFNPITEQKRILITTSGTYFFMRASSFFNGFCEGKGWR